MDKRFSKIFHLFGFLFVIIFFVSCVNEVSKKPLVEKGVIDLRTWNFQKEVAILDGDWEFYPNEFIDTAPSTSLKKNHTKFETVPGLWNTKMGGGNGYASYRVVILLPEDLEIPLAFKVSEHGTAYSMYANGKKIASNGVIGVTRETSIPEQIPLISSTIQPTKELEIIFHVSNFHYKDGGLWYSTLIGQENLLRDIREKNLLLTLFLCGSILIMALYHLTIYTLRKKDKSPLLFGLFCLVLIFRLVSFNEKYLAHLLPNNSFIIINRIEYLGYYLAIPIFSHFLQVLFPFEFKKRILSIIYIIATIFVVMVIGTPSWFYTYTANYYHVFTLLSIGYYIYVILMAIIRKREGASIILVGTLIIVIGTINDILHSALVINTRYIVPESLLGFIFAQSIILAVRFSKAFNDVEILSKSLGKLNLELEEKVVQRTEEFKQQKEIAESASSIKDKFVSIVSHDLRAPLLGVSNLLELLSKKDMIPDEEDRNKYITMAWDSIQQCLKLVRQLLDLSRIETGVLRVRLQSVCLRIIVAPILEELSLSASAKGVSFQCNIVDSDLIRVDTEIFPQVIRNLLTNSIKFSKSGGIISIELSKADNFNLLLVKDTGVGMSSEKLKYLFLPNESNSSLGTSGEKGSGMGLFICKYIVEAHKGKIHFESKEGQGTLCTISLPI